MKRMIRKAAALLLAGCLLVGSGFSSLAAVGAGSAIAKGVDVSKYQGLIDWNRVAASGISFAFIKLGSTSGGIDPCFDYNIRAAQAAGIRTGVYVYSYARNVQEAQAEAAMMVAMLEPYIVNMPVVLDIEDKTQKGLDTNTLQSMCYTFYQVLDAAGYVPMIYSNKNWFETKIGNIIMDKWVAQWAAAMDYAGGAAFWQCSETGVVPGIAGYVDLDYQFKDYSGIIVANGLVPRLDGNVRLYLNYKMQRGWVNLDNALYLADAAGNLVRGFFTNENGTYYFDLATCQAARGLTPVGENVFYFDENCLMRTGLLPVGDGLYYFDRNSGAMARGLVMDVDGNFYFAGADGRLQSGFVEIDGQTFLFDPASFAMVRNAVIPGDGFNYVIDANGIVTQVPIAPALPPIPEGMTEEEYLAALEAAAAAQAAAEAAAADQIVME